MSADLSDLSSLAALAWDPSLDVRPALLRVHADLFANAPVRDRAAIDAFEALALGLLPSLDDRAALTVARILAPVADTPASVVRLLVARGGDIARTLIGEMPRLPQSFRSVDLARNPDWAGIVAARPDLGPADLEALVLRDDPAIDLSIARNQAVTLSGRVLGLLVDRARRRDALARALLERADLSAADRAALYLAATPAQQDAIRASIEASPRPTVLPRASREAGAALVERAMAGDGVGFEAGLVDLLGLDAGARLDATQPGRHDLLGLALLAAGIGEEDCIRIFLTLDDRIARSVDTVFRLAALVRGTPRSAAIRLVEAILDRPLELRRAGRHQPMQGAAPRARTTASAVPARPEAAWRAASGRRD